MPNSVLPCYPHIQPRLVAEAVSNNSHADDELIRSSDSELLSKSDAELLSRFCEAGDETGFRAIVERHAAMVSSVCLSVLRNNADAEDAFQATFFVLARKARTVRDRKSLAAWLHRVALRSALAARRKRSSRPATELPSEDVLPESALKKISSKAVVSALHEELDRLPEKYRTTLITCYLEGASRREAAQQLGITEAAVKTRLERARRMLRRRLGVLGFAAFSAAGLCQLALVSGAKAMSAAKIASTVGIAMQVKVAWSKTLAVAAGNQASLNLAQGVLKTMFIATALKTSAATLLGLFVGMFAMTAIALADDPPNPTVVEKETEAAGAAAAIVLQDHPNQEVVDRATGIVTQERASREEAFTQQVRDLWRVSPAKDGSLMLEERRQDASLDIIDLTLPVDSGQRVVDLLGEYSQWRPMQALVTQDESGQPVVQWRMVLTPPDKSANTAEQAAETYRSRALWPSSLRATQEVLDQNDQLRTRVTELEEALRLHRRVAELEAENARLKAQLRQQKDGSED